jgi:hypothetical protein
MKENNNGIEECEEWNRESEEKMSKIWFERNFLKHLCKIAFFITVIILYYLIKNFIDFYKKNKQKLKGDERNN